MAAEWPLQERAADMTRAERRQFQRLVRDLPEPTGPFIVDNGAAFAFIGPPVRPLHGWRVGWTLLRFWWPQIELRLIEFGLPLTVIVGILIWASIDL